MDATAEYSGRFYALQMTPLEGSKGAVERHLRGSAESAKYLTRRSNPLYIANSKKQITNFARNVLADFFSGLRGKFEGFRKSNLLDSHCPAHSSDPVFFVFQPPGPGRRTRSIDFLSNRFRRADSPCCRVPRSYLGKFPAIELENPFCR